MTASSAVGEAVRIRELSPAHSEAQAPAYAHAREAAAPLPVTVRDTRSRARASAQRLGEVLAGDSLLHAAPPSLHQAREHHHAAAGRWGAPLIRWGRLAWGYLHLLACLPLRAAEWVLGSPARSLVAAIVFLVIWLRH